MLYTCKTQEEYIEILKEIEKNYWDIREEIVISYQDAYIIIFDYPASLVKYAEKKINVKPTYESISLLLKTDSKIYFTDGILIIKGDPKRLKYSVDEKTVKEESLLQFLNLPTNQTKLLYYVSCLGELEVKQDKIDEKRAKFIALSKNPIGSLVENTRSKKSQARAVFEKENRYIIFCQSRLNAITNRFQDLTFGLSEHGYLIAYQEDYQGKEPVAALAPMRVDSSVWLKQKPFGEFVDRYLS